MQRQFQHNIERKFNLSSGTKIIVAVSGGVDSMVLLKLCKSYFYDIVIAHCNFNLRDKESDMDESFVQEFAEMNNLKCFAKKFNTEIYAKKNRLSIQEAARNLRYKWFEKLLKELNYDCIAIGHNKNDSIETFIFNLSRGTGINGLTGIPYKNDKIIRPLLAFKRNEILAFAQKENIPFREDSSNIETNYSRNYIRHKIIPEFNQLNPQSENHIHQSIEYLSELKSLLNEKIFAIKDQIINYDGEIVKIDIPILKSINYKTIVLFEILQTYDFNSSTIHDIIDSLDNESGKVFHSETYQIIKDRTYLIIKKISNERSNEIEISKSTKDILDPIYLNFKKMKNTNFEIKLNAKFANLDFDKLSFPLKLRPWKEGDKFIPLGMKNYKKLSDFFIDEKLNLFEKKEIKLVTDSNNQIVWIVGMRIDERFKISDNTKNIYLIELKS